jgi:hypothetical protein
MATYEKETYRTTLGDYCSAKGLEITQIEIEPISVSSHYFGIFNGRAYKKARAQFDHEAARFDAVVDFGEGPTFQPEKSWMNFLFNLHSEGYQMRGTGIKR